MAQTTLTYTVGDLVASTLSDTRQEIVDNIHKKSVYLAKMMMDGRKRTQTGGYDIRRSVEYALNTTSQAFDGYDLVPIVPQETVTDTVATWRNYAANWTVAWTEERANAGSKTKIRDLTEQKKTSMENSLRENINDDLLNPTSFTAADTSSSGASGFDPLTMLISRAALTVDGVSETTNSWWANQRKKSASSAATATAGSVVVNEMRNFYNTCGKFGDGFPNFGLFDQELYELYEAIQESKVRYGSTEMANLGFETMMLKSMELAWDQKVPKSSANSAATVAYDSGSAAEVNGFFINTKYLYFTMDTGGDFIMTPATDHQAGGQFCKSGAMLVRGAHHITNRRSQGFYHGVDISEVTLTT